MSDQTNNNQINQRPTNKSNGNLFLGLGLAVVFAAAAFFSGLQLGSDMEAGVKLEAIAYSLFTSQADPATDVDLNQFWRVWNLMEEKYVSGSTSQQISKEERLEGAIEGLVKSYNDPYTIYLPPKDAEQFEEDISGNFSGVGMEVGIRDNIITVISPLPGTPAEKAGIVAGDAIVRIDDKTTEDMSIDKAVNLIRGEKGTEVKLTIYREGEQEFLEIPVVRDTILVPTIKTELKGDVFIISLFSFNAIAEMKMQEALREYVNSGANKIILDLRGNPGGFLQSAVSIAGYFLPAGKVVVRENFGENIDEQVFRSQGKSLKQYTPEEIVVLINKGSASASEILAGALKEHGVATLIGETTFGKGSVQELVELPDGSSLKVTVARWLTPNGTSISDGGLAPDIKIGRTPQQVLDDEDPQLEAALKWLAGDKNITDPADIVDSTDETEAE
jgi:carboxyl-terminal processing protease